MQDVERVLAQVSVPRMQTTLTTPPVPEGLDSNRRPTPLGGLDAVRRLPG
jgi:hypothetical protein